MKTFRLLDKSHVRHLKAHLTKLKSKGTIKNVVKRCQNHTLHICLWLITLGIVIICHLCPKTYFMQQLEVLLV